LHPQCNTTAVDTSTVTPLGIGSSNGVIPMGGESVIFRVPTSFPPRVNAGKAGVAMLPGSFSDRKIVDQNLLEQVIFILSNLLVFVLSFFFKVCV